LNRLFHDVWRWIQDSKRGALSLDTVSWWIWKLLFYHPTEKNIMTRCQENRVLYFLNTLRHSLWYHVYCKSQMVCTLYSLYIPFSGGTCFQAEGLHFMMKHLRGWWEGTIDCNELLDSSWIVRFRKSPNTVIICWHH